MIQSESQVDIAARYHQVVIAHLTCHCVQFPQVRLACDYSEVHSLFEIRCMCVHVSRMLVAAVELPSTTAHSCLSEWFAALDQRSQRGLSDPFRQGIKMVHTHMHRTFHVIRMVIFTAIIPMYGHLRSAAAACNSTVPALTHCV